MDFQDWLANVTYLLGFEPKDSLDDLAALCAQGLTPQEVVESCLVAA
jgi:hypothetical protein